MCPTHGEQPLLRNEWRYFAEERRVSSNPSDPRHLLPAIPAGARVLDVGCGGSWEWERMGIASYVGIDPDPEAIRFCEAMDPSGRGTYLQGFGEDLTRVPDRSCSFVMARVSVPYMDIGAFVREAHRVLEPGGQLWISYHTPRHVVHHLGQSLRARHVKDIVFRSYVLVNGAAFHLFGRQFRFPYNGRIESFQTRRALRRALVGAGFGDVEFQYDSRRDLASAMARRAR